MKPSQVRDQFSQATQSLSHAASACEMNRDVPAAMGRRLTDWSCECERLHASCDPARDKIRLRARVDALERHLHLLARFCQRRALHPQVELAVEHAHAVMVDLKTKLH